jgi:hypothetical protein
MFNWTLSSARFYCLVALLVAIPALALAPSPAKEFWDYVEEFGDQNGNVVDPLEFDQIVNLKNDANLAIDQGVAIDENLAIDESLAIKETPHANKEKPMNKQMDKQIDKLKIRHADMKIEQQSSSQASSGAMKGAAL